MIYMRKDNDKDISTLINNSTEVDSEQRASLKSRKKVIILLIIFLSSIVIIPIFVIFMYFCFNELGWNEDYSGMYKTELPIESPAKGGTLYLPLEWEFKNEDGWYSIINNNDNSIIAIEAYHGYENFIQGPSDYEWVDYEVNQRAEEINYSTLNFKTLTNGSNNCYTLKSDSIYGIYFFNTCLYKKRRYSRIYIFVADIDIEIIKKIDRSYTWGGEVQINID